MVVKAFEEIDAALTVLVAEVEWCGSVTFSAADPLAGLADGCLDILAGARAVKARVAGVKAKAAVACVCGECSGCCGAGDAGAFAGNVGRG